MDLVRLDRDLRRASRAVLAHHEALAHGRPTVDPWLAHREVARGSLYADVARLEVGAHERELKDAALAWIAWLTATRVSEPAREAYFEELHKAELEVRLDRLTRVTWPDAWRGLLLAPNVAVARAYFSALGAAGPRVAPRARLVREIHDEAITRLFGAQTLLGSEDDEATVRAARRFVTATDDLARDVRNRARRQRPEPWPLALDVLSAGRAPEGWPAHLGQRWLEELFGAHVRGLSIEMKVPQLISPASFVRALGAFGVAFREACCGPSVLARPPRFADAHRFAAVFASLGASEPFARRALGLAAAPARDQSRVVGASLLLSLRLACTTLLAASGLIEPEQAGPEDELPRAFAGAWPVARDDVAARARGALSAVALLVWLRDRHDEDWWRNPLAWLDLRHGVVPAARVDADAIALTVRAFEEGA